MLTAARPARRPRPRRLGTCLLALAATLGLASAPSAALAALPTITVRATTSPPLTNGAHTGVTVTAGCASGRLVSGGGFTRLIDTVNGGNSPGPGLPKVPTNGLVLGGSVPSTGASPVDAEVAADTPDPNTWMTISNFTGQAELGDQASSFAMCATGGPSHTIVKSNFTIGTNAQQATTAATEANLMGAAPPIVTTATCPAGTALVGGGAMTTTPDTINNGTTAGNNQNLKPLGSYPSDASGAMLADGSTAATSWSAYGSSGNNVGNPTDKVIAFAVCSTDAAPPPVQVARADATGPLGQIGTTVLASPVSCPTGTRLLAGGYKVLESVGSVTGLQPQQGYHMRGTYPTAGAGTYLDNASVEAADGALNPTTWTAVGQLGGQTLGATQRMVQHGFALCSQAAPEAPAATTGAAGAITNTGASLAGTVTPNGLATAYVFEYGPTLSFGSITTPDGAGAGTGNVPVTGTLTGLANATTYYYRLVASNSLGTTFGTVSSFTTGPASAPVVVTLDPTAVGSGSAVLAATVNPRAQQTAYTFEYGTTTTFGSITPVVALDDANGPEPVSAALSGLAPNTVYLYRVVATNATGTSFGAVKGFTTGPPAA